ncbi:MAG: hypothetical protein JXX29_02335 [Deltaproteobacteria bacterium]|nr:hypothetical protein [Deltaproteobacteria bacterium]MBN2670479.1 hypothetical protein [Deltaproteobacteria bacterium]
MKRCNRQHRSKKGSRTKPTLQLAVVFIMAHTVLMGEGCDPGYHTMEYIDSSGSVDISVDSTGNISMSKPVNEFVMTSSNGTVAHGKCAQQVDCLERINIRYYMDEDDESCMEAGLRNEDNLTCSVFAENVNTDACRLFASIDEELYGTQTYADQRTACTESALWLCIVPTDLLELKTNRICNDVYTITVYTADGAKSTYRYLRYFLYNSPDF